MNNEFMNEGEVFGFETPSKEEYISEVSKAEKPKLNVSSDGKAVGKNLASVVKLDKDTKKGASDKAGLVVVDLTTVPGLPQPKAFNVDAERAQTIVSEFTPHVTKFVTLKDQAKEFLKGLSDAGRPWTSGDAAKAREYRLELVGVRGKNGVLGTHAELKAFYLNGGRFVDGLKKFVVDGATSLEEELDLVENFEKYELEKRQADLQVTREAQVAGFLQYEHNHVPQNLGQMDENAWQTFFLGSRERDKQLRDEKLADEKRARAAHLYNRYLPLSAFDDLGKKELSYFEEITDAEFSKLLTYLQAAHKKSVEEHASLLQRQKDAEEAERLAKKAQEDLKAIVVPDGRCAAGAFQFVGRGDAPGATFNDWVDGFMAPDWDVEDARVSEVLSRFEGFKRWAKSL